MGTSHLSDEQIEDLMVRYYAGDNVAELIKEFRLGERATTLLAQRHETRQTRFCSPGFTQFPSSSD